MLKTLLKEPLLHFILIALLFFVAYQQLNPPQENDFTISVSEGRLQLLKNQFTERWKREPLPEEIQNSAMLYAINEMYLREARALAMDKGDTVIDRRIKQKMDYMLEDLAATKQPTAEEIQAFYQTNAERYMAPDIYSFQQVYLSMDRPQAELEQKQAENKVLLASGKTPEGDQTLLPKNLQQQPDFQIERRFGKAFVAELKGLDVGQWQGPIKSGLGLHYILIAEKNPATLQPLAAVQETVLQDMQYQNRLELVKTFEQKLQEKYTVIIAQPETEVAP
ncbi:peptidyl-prolyl cis-trans isomerase [Oceanicoccus sagamiensis]|uniref:PpiC domain-containing protein n=1 Tax=Oceanicoccus sagamiensis TaxID=716816 RepID=A0A1X9NAZ0_9GAMM|nr:peptidylprolyl isomerase [Oceanicoccus sagamiensis]ARN74321.1 hypothetical protein BST96_09405 [Oceanicoccus sagamiensis]